MLVQSSPFASSSPHYQPHSRLTHTCLIPPPPSPIDEPLSPQHSPQSTSVLARGLAHTSFSVRPPLIHTPPLCMTRSPTHLLLSTPHAPAYPHASTPHALACTHTPPHSTPTLTRNELCVRRTPMQIGCQPHHLPGDHRLPPSPPLSTSHVGPPDAEREYAALKARGGAWQAHRRGETLPRLLSLYSPPPTIKLSLP